jgi:uncharacterized cupredoxin-like copper-binding protein
MKISYAVLLSQAVAVLISSSAWADSTHSHHHHGSSPKLGTSTTKKILPAFEASHEQPTRTVRVEMTDPFVFKPNSLQATEGEIVRIELVNLGKTNHEFMLDESEQSLKEHADIMLKHPNMVHQDGTSRTLKPGQKSYMVVRFNRKGPIYFGCMMAGHYQGGMKGKIAITPKKHPV